MAASYFTFSSVVAIGLCAALAASGACSAGSSAGPRGSGGIGQGGGALDGSVGTGGAGGVSLDLDAGGDAQSNVGRACSASADCGTGYVCAQGSCARDGGNCAANADCTGDTFCCTGACLASGETQGKCVAYAADGGFTENCGTTEPPIGVFEARVQCEWTAPPAGDAYPDHVNVLPTPLTADLGNDSGAAAEIVAVTYNLGDGGNGGLPETYYGVIRILNGQTCELDESIDGGTGNRIIETSTPAIGDLDGDGIPEIVAFKHPIGLIAFKWNPTTKKHERYWTSSASSLASAPSRWDGPNIQDLDDDGFPEVIDGTDVHDGRTGARIDTGTVTGAFVDGSTTPVLGDLDNDGKVELIAGQVLRWNSATKHWDNAYTGGIWGTRHFAFADFGTPTSAGFDPTHLDGIAEIVGVGGGKVYVSTLAGTRIIDAQFDTEGGGPPTIGDFDGDGFPEVGVAARAVYAVIDIDCANGPNADCKGKFVRWTSPVQDSTSYNTGSSVFDFEGDGKAEAVYGDECFTRVYSGSTGEVLFSAYRTSCTWFENPIVADPDRDENTEIISGSNRNCGVACPDIDPVDPGVRCDVAQGGADCPSGTCDAGFCRCTSDTGCDSGYRCRAPLAGTPGSGNTCRAYHPPGSTGQVGIRVLRDWLDRWISSRAMWNQHAYSITNVNDDGTIPKTSDWQQNFKVPGLNNFRENVRGAAAYGDLPDITGALSATDVCHVAGTQLSLQATVCNRGRRAVGAALPATFYDGDPASGKLLCTSYTSGPVPTGGCLEVSCDITQPITEQTTITMVVNDDGKGGKTTVECDPNNNRDAVTIQKCDTVH